MADQDYSMNDEFQQDGQQYDQQDYQMNGNEDGNEATGEGNTGNQEPATRDDDRKLFVGGMSWETSDKELRSHFQQYGDIESISVKTDPTTNRFRGFAFIVFASSAAIDKALSAGDHIINNKKVDVKKARARQGKIFVGGLSSELSDDDIKNYFGQYGNIVEVQMPFDKVKNQRKGFCFITFESDHVVKELLKSPKQTINGKEVDVKKVTPKPDAMGGMQGGRGGRGRGRGARGARGGYASQGWGGQSYGGYGAYDQGYGGYTGYDYYGNGYGGYGAYDYSGYSGYGGYGGNTTGYGAGKQRGGRQMQRHQPY